MKGQQFRFRIIALLLIALLGLAAFSGLRFLSPASDAVSLRDAILHLTGQITLTPPPEIPSGQTSGEAAGSSSPSSEEPAEASASPSPGAEAASGSPSVPPTGETVPGDSGHDTPPPPFSEALSQYFSDRPPENETAPSPSPLP